MQYSYHQTVSAWTCPSIANRTTFSSTAKTSANALQTRKARTCNKHNMLLLQSDKYTIKSLFPCLLNHLIAQNSSNARAKLWLPVTTQSGCQRAGTRLATTICKYCLGTRQDQRLKVFKYQFNVLPALANPPQKYSECYTPFFSSCGLHVAGFIPNFHLSVQRPGRQDQSQHTRSYHLARSYHCNPSTTSFSHYHHFLPTVHSARLGPHLMMVTCMSLPLPHSGPSAHQVYSCERRPH